MGPKLPTSTGELSLPDFWTKKTNRGWNLTRFFPPGWGKTSLEKWPLDPPDFCGYFYVFLLQNKSHPKTSQTFFAGFSCTLYLKFRLLVGFKSSNFENSKFVRKAKSSERRNSQRRNRHHQTPPTRQLELYIRLTIPEISGFKLQTVNSSHPTLAISRIIKTYQEKTL